MSYAKETEVPVSRSQSEIQEMLSRAGASSFGLLTEATQSAIGFTLGNRKVQFVLPMPSVTEPRFTEYKRGYSTHFRTEAAARALWEQACRSRWRALKLCIKAKLEAVEVGITTFDDEFLAHIVTDDGRTIGERIIPRITAGGALLMLTEGAA